MIAVPLTRSLQATVDDEDAWVLDHTWHAKPSSKVPGLFYAARARPRPRKGVDHMHRLILRDACLGLLVDHIDGNGLNNRRCNLRAVSTSENTRNVRGAYRTSASGILGVRWDATKAKWRATIYNSGKTIYLGYFADKASAIEARLSAEKELWGVQPRRSDVHSTASEEGKR